MKLCEARRCELKNGSRAIATVVPPAEPIPNNEAGLAGADVVFATAAVALALPDRDLHDHMNKDVLNLWHGFAPF